MKTIKNLSGVIAASFTQDQELIWDSGAGYDVATFKQKSSLFNGKWADCKMKTGESKGKVVPIDIKQLNEFTLERWSEMRRRYDAC